MSRTVVAGSPIRGPAEAGAASWKGYVKDKDLTAPPGSPALDDSYIVASPATGAWSGEEDALATWDGSQWLFETPAGGWTVWVEDEGEIYVYNGASWAQESFGPHAATHKGGGSDAIDVATSSLAGLISSTDKAEFDKVSTDWVQVIFVSKKGNDTYSGKTPHEAKLTFASAITAAGTPASEAAAISIVCLDDGEYDEDLTCVDYVNIFAPNATLKGKQTLAAMHLTGRRMINDGDNEVIVKAATGTSHVTVGSIYSTAATKDAVSHTVENLKLRAGRIETTQARAVSIGAGGTSHLDLETQEIIAATECLYSDGSAGVMIARVGRMSGGTGFKAAGTNEDEIDAVVGRIACTAAYDIGASSVLRLIVGELSGTETAADGADVRVTRARRDNYTATTNPGIADDNTDGYTIGSTWVNVSTDEAFVCVDASTGAAVWWNVTGGVDQVQILYVGKHGNDSYSGKTPDQAKLTFASAITAAGTPGSEAAAITVVCLDDGEYDEDLTCVDYVNVYAPNAVLKGQQALATMHLTVRRMINDGGNYVILKSSSGRSYVTVANLYSTAASAGIYQTDGDLRLSSDRIESTSDWGIRISSAGAVNLDLEAKEMIGSVGGIIVSAVSGVVTARIGRMSGGVAIRATGTDQIDAMVCRIACTTAYDINVTSSLRLIVGELSGTETAADGADVRVTKAQRNNYVATTDPTANDDTNDGYTVGSVWFNATGKQWWICRDATSTAAVWDHISAESVNEVSTTDATVTTIATIPIPDDTAVWIEANVVNRQTNAANRGKFKRGALVYREAAGAATLEGGVWTPLTIKSVLPAQWDVTITVSGNNALIQVEGLVGHDINWESRHTVEERS